MCLLMIGKKNLWRWLTVYFILTLFHVGISGQIEENLRLDSLKVDSAEQSLKMILEKKDTTLLILVDSLVSFPSKKKIIESDRDPRRAWWYSAILPGLGQAYNRKQWKIPIIYTVFITTYYMINDNNFKYIKFKDAYADYDEVGSPTWAPNSDDTRLKSQKDFYKRNRDLGIIIGVMMYLMNIVDASVDANFMDFDISDDLSMSVSPEVNQLNIPQKNSFGLKFVITMNK